MKTQKMSFLGGLGGQKPPLFLRKSGLKTAKMPWKGSRKLKGEFRQKYRVFGENSKKRGAVFIDI